MKHNLSYSAEYLHCKGCNIIRAAEKLDEGFCDICKREMLTESAITLFFTALFVSLICIMVFGCESNMDKKSPHNTIVNSYSQYMDFLKSEEQKSK